MALALTKRGQWGDDTANDWASQTSTSATTGSFTPSNNSLLVVVYAGTTSGAVDQNLANITISDTAGLTWTEQQAVKSTTSGTVQVHAKVWTAPVATGASMTITISGYDSTNVSAHAQVFDFTGHDSGTPIGGKITGTNLGSGAVNITLDAAPASGDYTLAWRAAEAAGSGKLTATPTSGWNEEYDVGTSGWACLQTQTRTGSTSTAVQWDDVAVGDSVYTDESIAGAIAIKASGAVNVTAEPGAGSLTLTGAAPSVAASASVAPAAGTLSLSGQTPSVAGHYTAEPAAQALALSGAAPTISAAVSVTPDAGALSLAGQAPSVAAAVVAAPGAGALAITGRAPSVSADVNVTASPDAGALTLTGAAPSVSAGVAAAPATAALILTGFAPSLATSHAASPAAGTLTLTGQTPTVSAADGDASASPASGALTLTGFRPVIVVRNPEPPPGRTPRNLSSARQRVRWGFSPLRGRGGR